MRRLRPHTYSYNVFVGIPRSPLYDRMEAPGENEHKDEVGLLYPPGFDVRVEYFYGRPAAEMVEAEFSRRTPFDAFLLREKDRRDNRPRVSVVMAVHNGEPYLSEAMESILTQDFKDLEFVVIDDASTDDTPQFLTEYSRRDPRVFVYRNPERLGVTPSLNLGLVLAHGEYIARQDADDVSLPGRLARQVAFLDAHSRAAMVASAFRIIDSAGEAGREVNRACPPDAIPWLQLFYNYVGGHSTVMLRASAAIAAGLYNEERVCAQDHDLWLRIARHGQLAILPDVLLHWRLHESNISVSRQEEQNEHTLQVSVDHLSRLLGRSVEREEAMRLRVFWMNLDSFPGSPGIMDRTLRSLVWPYTRDRQGRRNKWLSYRAARHATSRRWAEWALREKDLRGWWSAVPYLCRSFRWSPSRCAWFLFGRAFASLRRRCFGGRLTK